MWIQMHFTILKPCKMYGGHFIHGSRIGLWGRLMEINTGYCSHKPEGIVLKILRIQSIKALESFCILRYPTGSHAVCAFQIRELNGEDVFTKMEYNPKIYLSSFCV